MCVCWYMDMWRRGPVSIRSVTSLRLSVDVRTFTHGADSTGSRSRVYYAVREPLKNLLFQSISRVCARSPPGR